MLVASSIQRPGTTPPKDYPAPSVNISAVEKPCSRNLSFCLGRYESLCSLMHCLNRKKITRLSIYSSTTCVKMDEFLKINVM